MLLKLLKSNLSHVTYQKYLMMPIKILPASVKCSSLNGHLSDKLLRSDLMQECLLDARGFLFVPIAYFANTKRYLKKNENRFTCESLVLELCTTLFSTIGSTAN